MTTSSEASAPSISFALRPSAARAIRAFEAERVVFGRVCSLIKPSRANGWQTPCTGFQIAVTEFAALVTAILAGNTLKLEFVRSVVLRLRSPGEVVAPYKGFSRRMRGRVELNSLVTPCSIAVDLLLDSDGSATVTGALPSRNLLLEAEKLDLVLLLRDANAIVECLRTATSS